MCGTLLGAVALCICPVWGAETTSMWLLTELMPCAASAAAPHLLISQLVQSTHILLLTFLQVLLLQAAAAADGKDTQVSHRCADAVHCVQRCCGD
jgi:hypothetical protein